MSTTAWDGVTWRLQQHVPNVEMRPRRMESSRRACGKISLTGRSASISRFGPLTGCLRHPPGAVPRPDPSGRGESSRRRRFRRWPASRQRRGPRLLAAPDGGRLVQACAQPSLSAGDRGTRTSRPGRFMSSFQAFRDVRGLARNIVRPAFLVPDAPPSRPLSRSVARQTCGRSLPFPMTRSMFRLCREGAWPNPRHSWQPRSSERDQGPVIENPRLGLGTARSGITAHAATHIFLRRLREVPGKGEGVPR